MRNKISKTFKNTIVAAIAALLISAAVPASANLITNGSFETPNTPYTNANYIMLPAGSTVINGWTVVGGPILHYPSNRPGSVPFLPGSDGNQWIDLTGETGYGKGMMSDPIATVVGATYQLSFDIGDVYLAGYQNSSLSVSINGGAPVLFNNIYGGGVMDWENKTLTWLADSSSVSFTFLGAANGGLSNANNIGLDNVVFNETIPANVPEPATMLLLASGIAGLFVYRKKY